MYEFDRLRGHSKLIPQSELLEHPLGSVSQCRCPAVEAGLLEPLGLARLDQRHPQRNLQQRVRQQGAGQAAADDEDVTL